MDVSYDEYYKRLVDQCAFNIACLATVLDTNYEYFAQDDFRVRKPDIKIKVGFEVFMAFEVYRWMISRIVPYYILSVC